MHVNTLVIGGGIIGLSVAQSILNTQNSPLTLVILEKESHWGSHSSSRNSEVIHAGFYYPQLSNKAHYCVKGRRLLYSYLKSRNIKHQRCGKLVVASTVNEESKLYSLLENGKVNDVEGLSLLSPRQLRKEEPWLHCRGGALHSAQTGILDSHHLMKSLRREVMELGGEALTQHELVHLEAQVSGGFTVTIKSQTNSELFTLSCDRVVNASGLWGTQYLGLCGEKLEQEYHTRYALGCYWSLQGQSPSHRLIYPLPEDGGLGIHLTIDLQGRARFGPDVTWLDIDSAQDLGAQVNYAVPWDSHGKFVKAIRRYWHDLAMDSIMPDYAGMRVKVRREDQSVNDFQLLGPNEHGVEGLIHLLGIESPGLTSALAIAEWVSQQLFLA